MTPSRPPQHRARPYHRSGLHAVSRALPFLLERVADPAIPDEALSPVEQAARAWRRDVVEDPGGPEAVQAAKAALLNAATGSKIILDSLDRYRAPFDVVPVLGRSVVARTADTLHLSTGVSTQGGLRRAQA